MDIETRLTEIEEELRLGHAEVPQKMLEKLLRSLRKETLAEWRPTLEPVIDQFQPKRRGELRELLDARIKGRQAIVAEPTATSAYRGAAPGVRTGQRGTVAPPNEDYEAEFRDELRELSRKHIFQWDTRYRDCLFSRFDMWLHRIPIEGTLSVATSVRRCLSEHSYDIFTKGYAHVRDARQSTHFDAVQKSVAGLARFLDLPLAHYSVQVRETYNQGAMLALRELYSAAFLGIMEGYATVRFSDERGDSLLPRFSQRWGHGLAFLTPGAAEDLATLLEAGQLTEGVERSVVPLLNSIDRLMKKEREDYFPLPVSSRFSWHDRFLEVAVRAPHSSSARPVIEARAYLDSDQAYSHVLIEALARNVAVVVAPLKADVREFVRERESLANMVVDAGDTHSRRDVVDRAQQVWGRKIFSLRTKRSSAAISQNIAREFPLDKPNPMPFYRVQRTSVRDLLRTFDRTNGVRLWCSVRRSGKTTACFGPDYTPADSVIVSQSCGIGPTENSSQFYTKVQEAVKAKSMLPSNFVEAQVDKCAPVATEERRKVLIIDEYETLFDFLRAGAEHDSYVRYTVVQPLLNQMTEFAQDNLLVLLGQQPDAHFILMDQNQLSPYVRQDPFPLFEYTTGTRAGEFGQLVERVLTDRIGYDPGFLGALHDETAGHPYLTVNVLCAFVDWLIEQKRPYRDLKVFEVDFGEFRKTKLTRRKIAMSHDYNFFREAIRQALSSRGYHGNGWLFTVYWTLRQISRGSPEHMSVPRHELPELLETIPAPGPLPDQYEILRTASQTNFLEYDDDRVGVKIKMLGRLAAAVRPGLA